MDIMTSFRTMQSHIRHADASARQIHGINLWFSYTARAVRLARELEAGSGCLEVTFSTSHRHRTWTMTADLILGALACQMEEARERRVGADKEAVTANEKTSSAASGVVKAQEAARKARERATAARVAAGKARTQKNACVLPEIAADFEKKARTLDAEAAAAEKEAADADEEIVRQASLVETRRKEAEKIGGLRVSLTAWESAARDARTIGLNVIRAEQPVAKRMYEGIQLAGGLAEIPKSKRYFVRQAASGRLRTPAAGSRGGHQ